MSRTDEFWIVEVLPGEYLIRGTSGTPLITCSPLNATKMSLASARHVVSREFPDANVLKVVCSWELLPEPAGPPGDCETP